MRLGHAHIHYDRFQIHQTVPQTNISEPNQSFTFERVKGVQLLLTVFEQVLWKLSNYLLISTQTSSSRHRITIEKNTANSSQCPSLLISLTRLSNEDLTQSCQWPKLVKIVL